MIGTRHTGRYCLALLLAASAACGDTEDDPLMGDSMGGSGNDGGMDPPSEASTADAGEAMVVDQCETITPRDNLSGLGELGTCLPEGIALPCRTESPEYLCTSEPSEDSASDNECRNTEDCAVLDAVIEQVASMTGESTANIVRSCGLPLLAENECSLIQTEATACIVTQTNRALAPGLSPACATCYSKALLCNLKCLAYCSLDAESPGCVACMHIEGCRGLFYQCSGLEPME